MPRTNYGPDTSGEHVVAYGVTIKLPQRYPNFETMRLRLRHFRYDSAAHVTRKAAGRGRGGRGRGGGRGQGRGQEGRSRGGHDQVPPILVSTEYREDGREHYYLDGIDQIADGAIGQILGSDHGFVLNAYTGLSGNEEDGVVLDPVIFLFTKKCSSDVQHYLGVKSYDLTIPSMSSKDRAETDNKIEQILRAFSMEAESPPGWKLIASLTLDPN